MKIFENVLIELPLEPENVLGIIRVLWIDAQGIDVVTIELNQPNALPVWQKCSELETALATEKARVLEVDPFAASCRKEDTIAENHRRRRDEAWEVIAPIVESREQVFNPSERGVLIKKAIERTGRDKVTIYKYLRRYWQGGQKPNALLPRFDLCGGAGKERQQLGSKLGRPSKQAKLKGKPKGINVDKKMRQIITSSPPHKF